MALDIVAGPGCDATKLPYVESVRQPGDVVISVGRIYSRRWAEGYPDRSNTCNLAPGVVLAGDAIKQARAKSSYRVSC